MTRKIGYNVGGQVIGEQDQRHCSQQEPSVRFVMEVPDIPWHIFWQYMGCSELEGPALFWGGQYGLAHESQSGRQLPVSEN